MSKTNQPQATTKWKVYGLIFAVMAIVGFVLPSAVELVAYPTAEHQETVREMERLNQELLRSNNFNSPALDELRQSDVAKYSDSVQIMALLVEIPLWIALVIWAYRMMREKRVTNHPVAATATIGALSSVVVTVPIGLMQILVTGSSSMLAPGWILLLPLTGLLTIVLLQ